MDVKSYLEVVVQPLFARVEAERLARDLVVASAIVTFHAVDYLARDKWPELPEKDALRAGRELIKDQFSSFEYLEAVANTYKHVEKKHGGRFKGLRDPLRQRVGGALHLGGKPLLIGGRALVTGSSLIFEFNDGTMVPAFPLIQGSLKAISEEAEALN